MMKAQKVQIDLDKRRYLLYDMSAIYYMEQRYGSIFQAINSVKMEAFDDTATMLYFGLMHEDESITIDEVDRLIDVSNRVEVIQKIFQALTLSLPDPDKEQQPTINQTAIDKSDGWDWGWLDYIGTVLLGMSEAVFWRCTPRRFFTLWTHHKRFNGLEEKETAEQAAARAWIDQFI